MTREIRSAPLRYGLALASFGLIMGASFGLQRVLPFRVDLTAMIIMAAGYQAHITKPVEPGQLAAAIASLGKNVKKN